MLEIKNLHVVRDNKPLEYTLSIPTHSMATLSGASGSGKSTLLLTMAGFVEPLRGEINWQSQSLLALPIETRPVAMLFQENNLFEHLSVKQNLAIALKHCDMETIDRAAHALSVDTHVNKMPFELSGGQRKRIALIRTMLRDEPIILLDEPFSGLDHATHEMAGLWVKQLAKQNHKTLLLTTHHGLDLDLFSAQNISLD